MDIPAHFFYTTDHEWISGKSGIVEVGISAHAIKELGEVVHIELPNIGEHFQKGDSFGTIESTKTVSDLYMPDSAKIYEVNKHIVENPESLTKDSYHDGWLIKVTLDKEITQKLMSANEYEIYLKKT